jgi:CheY-like chemotaxis protein
MSADMLSKAWTPFLTNKSGHQGLGLPAALHVISQAQGRMEISSQPGHGAQVQIWLPVGQVKAKALTSAAVTSILLLDDDDEWAQVFLKILTDSGLNASRQETLDNLPAADLLLVDDFSASFSMDDVLASVTKAGLASKTIVLTAALNPERVTRYLRAGLRDVQPKPYTVEEVAALLK